MTQGHCLWQLGFLRVLEAPQRVQDRALVGVQGAKPSDDLQILHFTVPMTPFTRVLNRKKKKNSSSSGTYEKRKICSTCFHNFGQVEAANEYADFLACTGTYAKKNRPEIFSRTSKFRNSHNLHEIDKKDNCRKPKRLPMILVTYALLTILVSYN